MWMLSFLPDFLVHTVLVAGLVLFLASTFLGMIPFINTYKTPGQILGVLLLAFGLYLEGGLAYKEKQAAKIAELETKLAEANARAEKKNTEIITKVIKDTKVIREKGDDIIKYIDREVVKYDDQCKIPDDVIKAYNEAATLGVPAKEDTKKMILPPRVSE